MNLGIGNGFNYGGRRMGTWRTVNLSKFATAIWEEPWKFVSFSNEARCSGDVFLGG